MARNVKARIKLKSRHFKVRTSWTGGIRSARLRTFFGRGRAWNDLKRFAVSRFAIQHHNDE